MAIPNAIKIVIESSLIAYIEQKIPPHIRDKVSLSYQFRGNSVTLIENRPYFRDPSKWTESVVAQFQFDQKENIWTLYCTDRNSRWHKYRSIEPNEDFDVLLQEVNEDPTGIFWG